MNPLGDNLLPLLVLAFGGAMAIGTIMALVRPPDTASPATRGPATSSSKDAPRVSLLRSIVFIAIGTIAAFWALASLLL
jgi:hypothetical protein